MLAGTEVKSLRDGRANISDAYGIVKDGEAVSAQPAHLALRTRGLLEPRARPHPQAVAPPQGNPSFDRSRRAPRTDARSRSSSTSRTEWRRWRWRSARERSCTTSATPSARATPSGKWRAWRAPDDRRSCSRRSSCRRRTPALVVRDARRSIRVAMVATPTGPMLRPEALAPMLRDRRPSRLVVVVLARGVGGARFKLASGRLGSCASASEVRQLAVAPRSRTADSSSCRFKLVSDVFPDVRPEHPLGRRGAPARRVLDRRRGTGACVQRSASAATTSEPLTTSVQYDDGVRRPPAASKHGRRTVIVDAGHGGVDNGMTGPLGGGPKIYEKDITLAVAKKLGARLQARGVDVVYTRTSDTLIALDDRGRIANETAAICSSRFTSTPRTRTGRIREAARGFETYFLVRGAAPKTRAAWSRWKTRPSASSRRGPGLDTGRPA